MPPSEKRGGYGLNVVVMLLLGAGVWLVATLVALTSCAGDDLTASGAKGPAGLLSLPNRALRSVSRVLTLRRGQNVQIDSLLDNARALLALKQAGVVKGMDEATTLAVQLAESLLGAAGEGGTSSGASALLSGGDAAGSASAAGDGAAAEVDEVELKRQRRKKKHTAKAGAGGSSDTGGGDVGPDLHYTQQTCYIGVDEAEICVYDGIFCFDGESPVIVAENPMRDPMRINDFTHSCMDPRFYEPASLEDGGCSFFKAGERKSFDHTKPPNPATDYPMSLRLRRWGPLNRNGLLFFREMGMEEIWGNQPGHVTAPIEEIPEPYFTYLAEEEGTKAQGPRPSGNDTLIEEPEPFNMPGLPELRLRRRTKVGNRTIDWLDGALWLAGIDGQWFSNPYHWFTKVGALYDARRANASDGHPNDGFVHWQRPETLANQPAIYPSPVTRNRATWRVGPQWKLPSMDVVAFAGDGSTPLDSKAALNDWFATTLEMAVAPHTRYFFNDLISRLGPDHMLCSTSGVIPGGKNKMFSGRADGWMWRQYAYQKAGLAARGLRSHPLYPPRKITIIDRKGMNGRGIYNRDEIIKAVEASGLPYELVNNMGKLTFSEQVTLMAGTGILIGPHGAAMANSMFLPAHAVVVELFPYLMKKNTYRYLAQMMDLHYYPLYSWELLPTNLTQYYGVELMNEMYFWENCVATNITSYDALNVHACNAASKNYPIFVDLNEFKMVLRNAIDTIGAYSLKNPAWKSIVEAQHIPPPPKPDWVKPTVKGRDG